MQMNANTIRFYLHSFDNLKIEIEHLKEALQEYRKMDASAIKAQVITDMPICHAGNSQTEDKALQRVEYIQNLEDEIDSKMRLVRAVESVMFYLRQSEATVMYYRYEYKEPDKPKLSWAEVAIKANYDEQCCKNLDRKIIHNIYANLLDKVPKANKVSA